MSGVLTIARSRSQTVKISISAMPTAVTTIAACLIPCIRMAIMPPASVIPHKIIAECLWENPCANNRWCK